MRARKRKSWVKSLVRLFAVVPIVPTAVRGIEVGSTVSCSPAELEYLDISSLECVRCDDDRCLVSYVCCSKVVVSVSYTEPEAYTAEGWAVVMRVKYDRCYDMAPHIELSSFFAIPAVGKLSVALYWLFVSIPPLDLSRTTAALHMAPTPTRYSSMYISIISCLMPVSFMIIRTSDSASR